MRRFENQNFPYHLAEAIQSIHLTIPDDESQNAISYIRQFVYLTASNSELYYGYIPENYIDALVRIRDESDNRDFNSAVEQIGVDGATSEPVEEYDELTFIEVENSLEAEKSVSSITREYSTELSDEARKNLYSINDLIMENHDTIVYYLPREIAGEIMPYLDKKGILL